MGQSGAAHSKGSHELFNYARQRALNRAVARVGRNIERLRKQALKKME
jgi:hypothetical protein